MIKTGRFVAEAKETMTMGHDGRKEAAVGRISGQQLKVFAMFALAFLLTGIATSYAHLGVTYFAVPAAAVALGLIGQMVQEAYRS